MTDQNFDINKLLDGNYSDPDFHNECESHDRGTWPHPAMMDHQSGPDNDPAQDTVPDAITNPNEQLVTHSTPSTNTMTTPEFESAQFGQDLQNSLLNEPLLRTVTQSEVLSPRASFQRQFHYANNFNGFNGTASHLPTSMPVNKSSRAYMQPHMLPSVDQMLHGGQGSSVQGTFADHGHASSNHVMSGAAVNADSMFPSLRREFVNQEPFNSPMPTPETWHAPQIGNPSNKQYTSQSPTIANSPNSFAHSQAMGNYEPFGIQGTMDRVSPIASYTHSASQEYPSLDEPINQARVVHQNPQTPQIPRHTRNARNARNWAGETTTRHTLKFNCFQQVENFRFQYDTKIFPGGVQRIRNDTLPSHDQYSNLVMQLVYSMYSVKDARDNPGVLKPWEPNGKMHQDDKALVVEMQCWMLLKSLIIACTEGPRLAKWGPLAKNGQPKQRPIFAERFEALKEGLRLSKSMCKRLVSPDYIDQAVDDPQHAITRIAANKNLNNKKKVLMQLGKEAAKKIGEGTSDVQGAHVDALGEHTVAQGNHVDVQGDLEDGEDSFDDNDDNDEDFTDGPPAKKSKTKKLSSSGRARQTPNNSKAQSGGRRHKKSPVVKEETSRTLPPPHSRDFPHPIPMRPIHMGTIEEQRGNGLEMLPGGGYGYGDVEMHPRAAPGTVDPRLFPGFPRPVQPLPNYPGRERELLARLGVHPGMMQPMSGHGVGSNQDDYGEDTQDHQTNIYDDYDARQQEYSQ